MCEVSQWLIDGITIAFGITLVAVPVAIVWNNIRLDRKMKV